jgi:hypothetical protein
VWFACTLFPKTFFIRFGHFITSHYLYCSLNNSLPINIELEMNFDQIKHPHSFILLNFLDFSQKESFASELGADSNPYLMIYNGDSAKEGSYQVVVGNPE